MIEAYSEWASPIDALYYADPLPEEPCPESESIMARLGFGPTTGVDSAMNHEGMLAIGLAMQEESDGLN